MNTRPRRRVSPYLEIVPPSLRIFVPALMSVGFVFWLVALVRDGFRRQRDRALARRVRLACGPTFALTRGVRPADLAPLDEMSLRFRFAAVSLASAAAGAFVLSIGSWTAVRGSGYFAGSAGVLGASLVIGVALVAVAAFVASAAWRWPDLTTRQRRWLARVPIGGGALPSTALRRPSRTLTVTVWAAALAAAAWAVMVGSSRARFASLEQRLLDAAADARWIDVAVRVDPLGSSLFEVVAGALLGLASFRCRVLVAAYPLAIGGAFVAYNVQKEILDRERPLGGPFEGGFDSFPSGHILLATALVGLLPLTVAVMMHTTRFVRVLRSIAGSMVVLGGAHVLHDRVHWPTDVFGAVLGGVVIVLATEWAIGHEGWHARCSGCPWRPATLATATHDHASRRGAVLLSVDRARLLGYASHAVAAGVAILLAVLTVTVGVPENTDGAALDPRIQQPVQLALAALVSMGALVSWKWPAIGAVLLALAATGLGVFAAVEYRPVYAVALTLVILTPAVLLWLSWQHHRTHYEITALAVVTSLLALGTWIGAGRVYAAFFGPTHRASSAVAIAVDEVVWVWSGGLGPRSIVVTARLSSDDSSARLVVSGGGRTWATALQRPSEGRLVRFAIDDLEPNRMYTYVIEVDGRLDRGRGVGSFRTPAEGTASFRLVSSSCAMTLSNGAVFDAIAAEHALVYLQLGDIHYENIAKNDVAAYASAYDRLLTRPGQAALYRGTPTVYVWDDHDYGPDNSDASSPSREAALAAYRATTPSHPLASEEGSIHRAFTIGRVRVIVTDTRSARTRTSMLGAEQLAWFEDEIVRSSRSHALVIWANPTPWIGPPGAAADGWGGYAAERAHIAQAIADADVDNLLMLSGDAHMIAFDDGTNSGYSSDAKKGFPVFQTAPLDRPSSTKGGPYSGGMFPGEGQYGVIDVRDDGTTIEVTLTGKNFDGDVVFSTKLKW